MIKVVSWNINMDKKDLKGESPWKGKRPWSVLEEMGQQGEADVALLQEVPKTEKYPLQDFEDEFWGSKRYDRRCRVVPLSNQVRVEHFRQVPTVIGLRDDEIGVSGTGTIAAARVIPKASPQDAFIAVSMYAQWIRVHPCTGKRYIVSADSAHRILSDLSAFIADTKFPTQHRILAAGDLNMFYGAIRRGHPKRTLSPEAPNARFGSGSGWSSWVRNFRT